MSSNATPKSRPVLLSLAHRVHAGQVTHGAAVGLHHHTAPVMDACIKKQEGDPAAAPGSPERLGSQQIYRGSITATTEAEAALAALSEGPVKKWLEEYQGLISSLHGSKPNVHWEEAGWPSGTTAMPTKHPERSNLLSSARAYLTAHPTYEFTKPQADGSSIEVTAAQALALHTQMQTATTLIDTRQSTQQTKKNLRDADHEELYTEVSKTIAELRDRLAPDDTRWELFGLNIPANPNPPEGVTSLTVTATSSGKELLEWPYAVRAEYYRVFLKRVGTDTEFVNVADRKDLDYTLKGLTPGETIETYVVPMNDGGAGPASPTVSKVVGA